jgi:excisionase family DNA binding protein
MSKLKPLLTLDEASTYLAVSKTTLRRWTNDGRLACHRVGPRNERRFDPDVLDSFVASGVSDAPELRAPMISGLSAALKESEADLALDISAYLLGATRSVGKRSVPFS